MATGSYYIGQRLATYNLAADTFGLGSFETEQCVNAWAAVGIGIGNNFCNPVGLENAFVAQHGRVDVYPNPANNVCHVVLSLSRKPIDGSLSL